MIRVVGGMRQEIRLDERHHGFVSGKWSCAPSGFSENLVLTLRCSGHRWSVSVLFVDLLWLFWTCVDRMRKGDLGAYRTHRRETTGRPC